MRREEEDIWLVDLCKVTGQVDGLVNGAGGLMDCVRIGLSLIAITIRKALNFYIYQMWDGGCGLIWTSWVLLRLSLANIFERYTHSIRMDYRSIRFIWQTYMVGRLDLEQKYMDRAT